ncbi:MAG: Cys-Gln thioester bond-forming surface protein, partial [Clostridia bacterium]|nr:Cys-Gln thioester bond-forming surface protein [Clostridia bacterium]
MSKSITKASAVMLAIMTLLSSIFVVQADAATGDKVTIAFYYCFDSGGNTIRYQQTTSNNGYTVGSVGEELCRITANGEEAYCIEPGHSLFAGDQLTEGSSSVWNSLGAAKQNAINLALLCGKPGSENTLPGSADEKWAATQLIVWEIVSDCRLAYGNYQCTNTKYIDGLTAGGANSGVKTVYNQIVSNMQTIQRIPSFAADSASNAKTYEMNAVNGGYSLSLYDGNSVLDKFNFSSAGGVTVSRSGNTLTLTARNPINSAVTLSATRVISGVNTSLIAYGDAGLQDVVTGTSGITVSVYFKVTAISGSLKLVKTSEDGIVAGIQFTVTGTNYSRNVVTNANGEFILNDLVPGTYTVTEKEDSRYEKQSPKMIKVESGKTSQVSFINTLRKGKLKIVKTSEDGIKAGIEFTITGKNYSKTAKSDKNGEIVLADLVPGTYTVTEKVDPRYEAQAPKTVVVQADKTAMVSFRNTLRKGNLKIIKTSEDGEIEGIQFVVSGKNYSKTVMTNVEGEMLLPDLVPGTYTVTEIVDERYEAQQPKTVIVEADKTATVSFKNTLRKGNLKIIKKSEDGIVAGIEFTVKGSSFNQTVKTNANGEMLLENLVPGVYTVTESVDDRYEPQAPKRVRVTADKTATVTFKNSIRKSSLKIFKISEDDIVADIEFTVIGANFKQTVRTNEDGEIALENLVPGTYTITESVDDRYEKQEPQTVTVEADKTATVTFKNTLRKGNLKIIKTSEDGKIEGIQFVVSGKNYSKTVMTNTEGEMLLTDLVPGTYTVTEIVDER